MSCVLCCEEHGLGRSAEGLLALEEAIAVHRRLVAIDPDTHQSHLACLLNSYASGTGEVGRPADGVAAIEEAITILRQLAEEAPARIVRALGILSDRLTELGRHDEAVRATDEARLIESAPRERTGA